MINLQFYPAFGFETATCNANRYHEKLTAMPPEDEFDAPHDAFMHVSHEGEGAAENDNGDQTASVATAAFAESARYMAANKDKVLGYIPLYGSYLGWKHLQIAIHSTLPNKIWHVVRAIIELLSIGLLLLIPDLIVTAVRPCIHKPKEGNYLPVEEL